MENHPDPEITKQREASKSAQIEEIVKLIQSNSARIGEAKAHGGKFRVAVLARAHKSLLPIAEALHEASIPFRAVELEKLKDRPEVLDALSLVRAVLNPQDRVAWLGVLRAPFCALALGDLYRLTSADDPELLARPVPDLLAERLPLLSEDGQRAASRVLEMWNSFPALRAARPTASMGTWLEQLWLRLGGAACVDASARANIDLLWSCLDGLPAGEQDLPGPALDAALDKLTALPDPEANSDAGVQLMTIHKSKGLEFEVVIVPDLQAITKGGKREMLSWLERGLAQPDEEENITEFLIAPFQPRSKDPGEAKKWVDRIYHQRESQEDRRILYVAATRARDELHLFARPNYKSETNGQFSLADPAKNSLLATAWPALEDEVRSRFEEWKTAREKSLAGEDQVIETIAASESNLLVMPTPAKPTLLRRLPLGLRAGAEHRFLSNSRFAHRRVEHIGTLQPPRRRHNSPAHSASPSIHCWKSLPACALRMNGKPPAPLSSASNPVSPPKCAPQAWIRRRPPASPPRRWSPHSAPRMTPSANGFSRPTPTPPSEVALGRSPCRQPEHSPRRPHLPRRSHSSNGG